MLLERGAVHLSELCRNVLGVALSCDARQHTAQFSALSRLST
jgi:hypothetical protein